MIKSSAKDSLPQFLLFGFMTVISFSIYNRVDTLFDTQTYKYFRKV